MLVRAAGGSEWGKLEHPGKNGIFIVLMSVAWWMETATTTAAQCQEAALDVSWVVWQLASSKGTSRKHPAELEVSLENAKKVRRC